MHQIGNMIINPDSGEVFQPSASNEQQTMKKMIFPVSSEENDIFISEEIDNTPFRPMNPTNPTRPTTKPALPVPQKEVVDSSKPVEVTGISGEEEYYDEYASKKFWHLLFFLWHNILPDFLPCLAKISRVTNIRSII